jgi:hypothetical protein
MRKVNRVLGVLLAFVMLMQISACATFSTKKLVTPAGVELSTPLSEVVNLLSRVKAVYITVGTIVGSNYDQGYISKDDFTSVALACNDFRVDLRQSTVIMLGWYDIEASGTMPNREKYLATAKSNILIHLRGVVDIVKATHGISPDEAQVIESAMSMLETLYGTGVNR